MTEKLRETTVEVSGNPAGAKFEVKKRYFDPEEHKVVLEISVGEPFNTTIRKTGSIGRIAFQLAEQFSLPIQPKDLAKILWESAQRVELEIKEEAQLYQDFLSWITENFAELVKNFKCFVPPNRVENEPLRIRLVESAMSRFFQAHEVPPHRRNSVLSYWREKGWLRVNSSAPYRFKKVAKFKAQDGTTRILRVYEVELRYDEVGKNAEEMEEFALLT